MIVLEYLRFIIGTIVLLTGLFIFCIELFGVFHLKYVLNRMHAAAMGDTLGISVCLVGLMIFSGWNVNTIKMALIIVFLWFSSPVSSHLIARMEAYTNPDIQKYCELNISLEELEKQYAEKEGRTKDIEENAEIKTKEINMTHAQEEQK